MVFKPTLVSQLIADNVDVKEGQSVLDIGCGTGFIGLAVKERGAQVLGSDIMPEAVDIARKQGLEAVVGDLFENVKERFDIIINDVSGICDKVARISPWYPDPVPTGGEDGSQVVRRLLYQAPNYLKQGGVLYLPVSSLSDTKRILATAWENFETKLVYTRWIPFCKELEARVDELRNLPIEFMKKGSRHLWRFDLYKCTLEA